jgi:16S rRNA processing protein RimM
MSGDDWEDMAVIGRVARAHGIAGAAIVNPETDFLQARFRAGRVVFVRRGDAVQALTIAKVRFHQGRPIVEFDGVATMNEAVALAGAELRVPESDLEPLPEGAYYRHQLVGCEVVTVGGDKLGTVTAVDGERDGSRLVVAARDGEVLVPLAREICVRIDPTARRIVIEAPDGLLDLNR